MPRIGVGIGLGQFGVGGSALDADALAYINALSADGYPLEAPEQTYINTLVTDFKSAGIWSKMKAIYPYCTSQRNLIGYTNNWTNAIWQGSSVTTGQTDPFGGTNAVLCSVEKWQSFSYTTLTQYTVSIYAKANTATSFTLGSDSVTNYYSTFNLSTQTVTNSTGYVGTITSIGNGWYRCQVTWTKDSGGAVTQPFYDVKPISGSMYYYGPQLELGSTATTYQPVATTASTIFASQFKYNLKDPRNLDAAFRQVFNGGWTYSKQGATPNGTNGYADTKLNSLTTLSQNSTHIGLYSRTNSSAGFYDMGNRTGPVNLLDLAIRYGGSTYGGVFSTESLFVDANSLGHYISNRISSTTQKVFKNGNVGVTGTASSNTPPNLNVYIGSYNFDGTATSFSSRQYAFASMGDGLTDSEASAMYTAVQQFNTSLNRQV